MMPPIIAPSMFPPFVPMYNPASSAQMFNTQDPTTANFQLTHLMALFQLQNPLFYQNLYPDGMAAMFSGTTPTGLMPQNPMFVENLTSNGSNSNGATNYVKTELNEKSGHPKE